MNDVLREILEEEQGLKRCVFPEFGYCYREFDCNHCPSFPEELKDKE